MEIVLQEGMVKLGHTLDCLLLTTSLCWLHWKSNQSRMISLWHFLTLSLVLLLFIIPMYSRFSLFLPICLVLQPFRMKVWKSLSTRCCWTDSLMSTRLHYKPLSITSTGEKHIHWTTHFSTLFQCMCVYAYVCFFLHVFQRAAFF